MKNTATKPAKSGIQKQSNVNAKKNSPIAAKKKLRDAGKTKPVRANKLHDSEKTKPVAQRNHETERTKSGVAKSLRGLFVDELKDIYYAEKVLVKTLPKMINKSSEEELIDVLTEHLETTNQQITRLEEIFSIIGEKPEGIKCEAMEGLLREADRLMEQTEEGIVRDSGIISAAQKVEHYEIASYGTLCAFARTLGEEVAASLLQTTLDEEKEADETLSEIGELMQLELVDEEEDNSEVIILS